MITNTMDCDIRSPIVFKARFGNVFLSICCFVVIGSTVGGDGGDIGRAGGGRNCESRYRAGHRVVFGQRFARRFPPKETSGIW